MRLLAALLFAVFACVIHAAEWTPAKRLDAYFDALGEHDLANGTLTISEHGEVRYRRAVGFAELPTGGPRPTTLKTRYRIGSVSKLYTAVLIVELSQKKPDLLAQNIAAYFPELPNASRITIRHLVQHRSGLADYSRTPGFEDWRSLPRAPAEVLKAIAVAGAQFEPGARVEYSNTNYLLLSYILEREHDKPFADILASNITGKLALGDTRLLTATGSGWNEALPYKWLPSGWQRVRDTHPGLHLGAGGIVSSTDDMAHFMDSLLAGKVIDPSVVEMMRGARDAGLGLPAFEFAGHRAYGHQGRVDEFQTTLFHFPENEMTIAYASNAPVLDPDEIVAEIIAVVFDRQHQPPTFEPVTLPNAKLDQYTGRWVSRMGRPAGSTFLQYAPPGHPPEMTIKRVGDKLIHPVNGVDRTLIPLGNDEFIVEGSRYFLRAYPQSGEVVVRSPFWAYYFKRAE
jgi:CubicO group peptidase (beta-lactamase class C family)